MAFFKGKSQAGGGERILRDSDGQKEEPAISPPVQTTWETHVNATLGADDLDHREHLWLGLSEKREPILLHRDILCEHGYMLGDTGSGKTSLGITPLVAQLIRQRNWKEGQSVSESPPHAAIVIIDLKGDMALFETARLEAQAQGRTFKFFTNELGKATHTYNPFRGRDNTEMSAHQIAQTFLEALNLNHGEGYGRSYYSRMARRWLTSMLRRHKISSFEELYKLSAEAGAVEDKEERHNIFELLSVIESLSSYEQLNVTLDKKKHRTAYEHAIFMPEVVRERQIVYFWLPSNKETTSVKEVAKLVVYDLLQCGHRDYPTYLIIDEFQRIVSEGYKLILQQARSMGIRALMANQGLYDLKTNDTDLRSTVWTNTRFKQIFSVTDPDSQEYIARASGTKSVAMTHGTTISGRQEVPFIERNDLIETLNTDLLTSLVFVTRGQGLTRAGLPYFVKMSHSVLKEEHETREAAKWPDAKDWPGTLVPTHEPLTPETFLDSKERIQETENVAPTSGVSDFQERLRKLAEKHRPVSSEEGA